MVCCKGEQLFGHSQLVTLTGVGFRRMAQAHSAAIDVVIGIDGRYVLCFPGWDRSFTGERDY
jgi:hypothetical protein